MARFRPSSVRTTTVPPQRVEINGTTRRDVIAEAITQGIGLGGAACALRIPRMTPRSARAFLRDAAVAVYTHGGTPDFLGYSDNTTLEAAPEGNAVTVTARSVTAFLDRYIVGQSTYRAMLGFLRKDRLTRQDTGWTLSRIVRWLFSPSNLDANWRGILALGDVSPLEQAAADVELPDLVLATATMRDALNSIMALVPEIEVRERYAANGLTYLDFWRYGDPLVGRHVITVPADDDGPEQGHHVQRARVRIETSRVIQRVIGHGRPKETMLTVGTNHATAPLWPAWDSPMTYNDPEEGPPGPPDLLDRTTAAEDAVLADPNIATPSSPQFDPSKATIFREFKLPEVLRGFSIMERNIVTVDPANPAYTDEPGEKLPIQLFVEKYDYTESATPGQLDGAPMSATYEMVRSFEIDPERWVIRLPRPAVAVKTARADGTRVYTPVHVFLTITVADRFGSRLVYDTGIRGDLRFPGISETGTTESFINPSVGYATLASAEDEFTDAAGNGHTFGATWYDPATGTWSVRDPGSPFVIEDDSSFLQVLCEKILAEATNARTDAEAWLPYYNNGILIGDGLVLNGQGIDGRLLRVLSVTRDLVRDQTSIRATDQVPRTQVGSRAVAPTQAPNMGMAASRGGPWQMPERDMLDPGSPELAAYRNAFNATAAPGGSPANVNGFGLGRPSAMGGARAAPGATVERLGASGWNPMEG
jgi:hypothetical protein